MPHIAIIGAGAAGLTAAIAAARSGARVTLLEAGPRVGRKILASGNGRCNLSNTAIAPSTYNHPDFVAPVLAAYDVAHILEFFSGLGLTTYADDEGRIYPTSNAANSVLDVLRLECAHLGVEEQLGFEVTGIERRGSLLHIQTGEAEAAESAKTAEAAASTQPVVADAIVIATGGGTSLLTTLGHHAVPFVPVLCPIRTRTDAIRRLSGIRVRCAATLLDGDRSDASPIATERGELLFRDYGVSGIMIFDLSRELDCGCVLSIDFFPDTSAEDLRTHLLQRAENLSWRPAETFLDGMLHHTVAQALLAAAGIERTTFVTPQAAESLARLAKDFRLEVTGRREPKQAQVTRGGAAVDGFDPATLESRLAPGIFAAGEALDVDGRCGGYNLHWAWASGLVAGAAAAEAARETGSTGAAS